MERILIVNQPKKINSTYSKMSDVSSNIVIKYETINLLLKSFYDILKFNCTQCLLNQQ